GLAADADGFIEVDDAVSSSIHGGSGTGFDAGRMFALVAARDLKGAPRGGELADVDVLHVGAVDAEGDGVLGFARGAAGVAANAAGLVDDFPPLHRFRHAPKVSRPPRRHRMSRACRDGSSNRATPRPSFRRGT